MADKKCGVSTDQRPRITIPEVVIEITDGMACLTLKSKGVQVTFIDHDKDTEVIHDESEDWA